MIYMGNSNRNSSRGGGGAGHSAQFSVVRTDGAKKNNQNNNSNRRESCQKFKASVSQSAKLASPTGKSPEAQRERFSRNASLSLTHSCPAWCPVREEEPEVVASGHHQSHKQTQSAQLRLSSVSFVSHSVKFCVSLRLGLGLLWSCLITQCLFCIVVAVVIVLSLAAKVIKDAHNHLNVFTHTHTHRAPTPVANLLSSDNEDVKMHAFPDCHEQWTEYLLLLLPVLVGLYVLVKHHVNPITNRNRPRAQAHRPNDALVVLYCIVSSGLRCV